MYRIKIQRLDGWTGGDDVAQPIVIETLGEVQDLSIATALAESCAQQECVGAVWIEPATWIN